MSNLFNSIGKVAWLFVLPLMGVSVGACSDEWDNHYDAATTTAESSSLWEIIEAQGDMKNFARLLKETGYNINLSGSQSFTVFAPTDAVLVDDECQTLIDSYKQQLAEGKKGEYNSVIKEFVMNHIALYNHSVSSFTSDSIIMMNGKYQKLTSSSIGRADFITYNRLTKNGILFVIDKQLSFLPNIYEYLAKDADLDSVSAFIHKYDLMEFSEIESVPGDIINGKTHYLDSVTVLENILFSYLAQINSEDSSYMAILPTNTVWEQEIAKNQAYYVYDKKVEGRDSLSYLYPRMQILDAAFFSRTFNPEMETDSSLVAQRAFILTTALDKEYRSPIYGYRYVWKFKNGYSAKEVLTQGMEEISCSNGSIFKSSSDWYGSNILLNNAMLTMEAESSYAKGSGLDAEDDSLMNITTSFQRREITMDNPFYESVSEHGFVEISPKTADWTKAYFNIYNVLSNVTYDIYVVTVPPMAADTTFAPKGTQFVATLYYNDVDGKQQYVELGDYFEPFEASPTDLAYIKIGSFKFPTSSFGLKKPQVMIKIEDITDPFLVEYDGTHDYTLRIDNIVFVPQVEHGTALTSKLR